MQTMDNGNPSPAELRQVFKVHADLCKALANEHRLAILYALSQGEMCVTDLSDELELPIHNVSQHLRILQERLLVEPRKEGKRIYYSMTNRKFIEGCTLIRHALVEQLRTAHRTVLTVDLMDAVERIVVAESVVPGTDTSGER
jgi:DNA-binding transcriptional ArsR family regulator